MKIDNAQLAAFAAVIREGSFEAAARQLHVTPSAISQRIRQLEDRLGQVLVQRTTPCQPTAAGRTLLRFTEQLAMLEGEMLSDLGVLGEVGSRYLRVPVAVNADSLHDWFVPVIDIAFHELSITIDIRVEDQDYSAELLREGPVMAAVCANPTPIQGCTVQALGRMRYVAMASPGYVAKYLPDGISAATLGAAPMLAFSQKDGLQHAFIRELVGEAVQPPTHYVPSIHGFLEVAKRSMGWGMMPETFVAEEIRTGALVEIAPGHYLDVPLYWHSWHLRSPTLQALTAAVCKVARAALRQPGDD